ncbi:von willebrand factor [Moniliophthora roreri]|nr:von willebrand factor [Moniliophthora roreri]
MIPNHLLHQALQRSLQSTVSGQDLRTPMRQQTTDNMLETLRKYDTVIIVDDSSSMIGARWAEAASALSALADLAGQFDADGIDIHFLNDDSVGKNMTKRKAVENLFNQVRPRGVTPIGEKLEDLLRDYLGKLEAAYDSGNPKSVKPVNFVILTDADDPESVIVQAARRLDAKNFPLSQPNDSESILNLPLHLDLHANDDTVDIVGFLAFEMVRSLTLAGLDIKRSLEESFMREEYTSPILGKRKANGIGGGPDKCR